MNTPNGDTPTPTRRNVPKCECGEPVTMTHSTNGYTVKCTNPCCMLEPLFKDEATDTEQTAWSFWRWRMGGK